MIAVIASEAYCYVIAMPSLRAMRIATVIVMPSLRAMRIAAVIVMPSLRAMRIAAVIVMPSLRAKRSNPSFKQSLEHKNWIFQALLSRWIASLRSQ